MACLVCDAMGRFQNGCKICFSTVQAHVASAHLGESRSVDGLGHGMKLKDYMGGVASTVFANSAEFRGHHDIFTHLREIREIRVFDT